MKTNRILLTVLFAAFGLFASAQSLEHNWFVQGQLGASYSSGDASFGKLVAPAGAINVGYYFNRTIGTRLSIGGWRGRGGNGDGRQAYGFYHGSASVDALINLSTLFAGKNTGRLFDTRLIAGIGANQRFQNNSTSFLGRLGLQGSFRLNDAFAFNVEFLANGVSDRWNMRDDHKIDTYFNAMVGITYRFKTGFKMDCPTCEPVYYPRTYTEAEVQALNDKINEMRAQIDNHKCPEPEPCPEVKVVENKPAMQAMVLFGISQTQVASSQMMNVEAIANYMKQHPESRVDVSGYADKGTGSDEINKRLAQQRAEAVAEILKNKFGIAEERITVKHHGSFIQPFADNDNNRVVIMIANN